MKQVYLYLIKKRHIIISIVLVIFLITITNSFQKTMANVQNSQKIDWEKIRKTDIARVSSEWGKPHLINLSTSGWEEGNYISPDGKTFYFGYINIDAFKWKFQDGIIKNIGPLLDPKKSCTLGKLGPWNCGEYPRYDLFYSERTNEGWSVPKPHPLTLINPVKSIVLVNNNKAYFVTSFDEECKGEDIAYAEKKNGKWDKATKVATVNSKYREDDPYVNPEETEMFFWSNRPSRFEGHNIWKSKKVGGEWQDPELLPTPINSNGDDMQTFIFKDYLYFSSNRDSKGTMKIFKSKRLGDNEWGSPEIIVESNFAVGEPSLPNDGKKLYFEQIFTDGKRNYNPDMFYVVETSSLGEKY